MKRTVTLLAVMVGLGGLALLASTPRWSAATAAQAVLGVTTVGLAGWWSSKARRSRFELPPRMQVIQRLGLSPRSGLTLVQVDGRPYLVVHGEGFAQLHPAGDRLVGTPLTPESES